MNILDNIKLNFYPELKKLNFDEIMIQKILSNKKLKFEYTSYIKPFIKYLKEYKYKTYEDGKLKELSLDDETIKHHIV